VYGTLTGSACVFIAAHPERNPNIPSERIADWIYTRNTVIIPGDQVSGHKDAILALAHTFVKDVAVPWAHEWQNRAIKSKYLSARKFGFLCSFKSVFNSFNLSIAHSSVQPTKVLPPRAGIPIQKEDTSLCTPASLSSPTKTKFSQSTIIGRQSPDPLPRTPLQRLPGDDIPDELYDTWLAAQLAAADLTATSSSKSAEKAPRSTYRSAGGTAHTIPQALLGLVESLRLPGDWSSKDWAQWIINAAYAVPPTELGPLIEKETKLDKPFATILSSAALQSLVNNL
jgi:hypothetical protein